MQLRNGQKDQEKVTEKGKFSPHAFPISGRSLAGTLGVSWHWQVGINTQQGSPFLGCLQSWWGTAKLQSRAHHLLRAGHVIHRRVSKVENVYTEKAERLELWVFLPCPEDPGQAPKMIAYGEQYWICDLQRRFIFGTRDQELLCSRVLLK